MPSYGATAGGKKLTADERRRAEAASLFLGANKPVADAYARDPKTALAKALAEQAGSTEPVAAGGWGIAEGLGRVGSGFLSKMTNDRQQERYRLRDEGISKIVNQQGAMADTKPTPEQAIAAALTNPNQAQDEVASAAQAQNPAAAAAPAPPPQAAPPPVAPPGSAPGVPPQGKALPADFMNGIDPQQAAAVAQSMSGPPPGAPPPPQAAPPPGAPPPNPIPAPAPMGRGAAPSALPVPPSAQSTPQQGSLGGAEAADTLEGGTRVGLPTGDQIEQLALTVVPKIGVTSRQRSAAKNKQVGGVSNSFHKPDESGVEHARDFVPPAGMTVAGLHRRLKGKFGANFDVINEGDHVHIEPSAAAVAAGGATDTLTAETDTAAAAAPDGTTAPAPGEVEVPDLPPEEEAPKDVPVRQRIRSERLALARQILQNNPNASAVDLQIATQPLFDKGFDEEQKGREEEYAAQTARDNLRAQSEWQGYEQRRGQRHQSRVSMREEAQKENWLRQRGFTQHQYKLEETQAENEFSMTKLYEQDRLAQVGLDKRLEAQRLEALRRGDENRFRVLNSGPIVKELGDIQTAITAKDTNVGIAGRILKIVNTIDPSGVTNSGWTGQQRAKYSQQISELEGLQNKIVFGDAGGKLGGNFSNTDLAFIKAMNPVGPGTPVPTIRRAAQNIVAASKRDSEYGVHLSNAIQSGDRPQFTKDWNTYKDINPVFDAEGNVRDSGGLTFDRWVEMGKPMPPRRKR